MKTIKQLLDCVRGRNIPAEFENQNVDYKAALRDEIKNLAGTYHLLKKNGPEIFAILEQDADEIVPRKVMDIIAPFCEVQQFGNNDRIIFKRKLGRSRGKTYVTRATAAGVYETFRLDRETFEISSYAYGGAGIVDWERYLDGEEDLTDIYEILVEGLVDRVFEDIQGCLLSAWDAAGRPAANRVLANGFDGAKMASLINTVTAYGDPVIYCHAQFAATMANVITDGQNYKMSDEDIRDFRNQGYIGRFAGAPVVVMPNSFTDETNTKTVWHPGFAYVMPAGKEKLVKVALVGQTHMKQVDNEDWSMEIQFYKKIGVALSAQPHYWGIYLNTAIECPGWEEKTQQMIDAVTGA